MIQSKLKEKAIDISKKLKLVKNSKDYDNFPFTHFHIDNFFLKIVLQTNF